MELSLFRVYTIIPPKDRFRLRPHDSLSWMNGRSGGCIPALRSWMSRQLKVDLLRTAIPVVSQVHVNLTCSIVISAPTKVIPNRSLRVKCHPKSRLIPSEPRSLPCRRPYFKILTSYLIAENVRLTFWTLLDPFSLASTFQTSCLIITAFNCQAVTPISAFALVYGGQKWAWTEAAKLLLGYLERTSICHRLIIQSSSRRPCSRNDVED